MLKKHSLKLWGHATSITLEEIFWKSLKDIALQRNIPLHKLVEEIDETREVNLCSALRVYILQYYQLQVNHCRNIE